MDKIEKLINILKLTPHYQPALVKEACDRLLARSIREDRQSKKRAIELLRPLIEILIQYCDNEDSAQRSLFNDYLNTVVLHYQHSEYRLILEIFVNQVTNNGSARTVVAALSRIPFLIQNVEPIELGCEPKRLLKALIEICRRSEDESVLKALDMSLHKIIPYMDYQIRKSKDMQMLSNSLIELLLKNLQHESMQTKRLAASSLAILSSSSETLRPNVLTKLSRLLHCLSGDQINEILSGFSLCVKLIPDLTKDHQADIVNAILNLLENESDQLSLLTASLDILKDVSKSQLKTSTLERVTRIIIDKFLIQKLDDEMVIKPDIKVILRVNALACLANMISQNPSILDKNEYLLIFFDHSETAIKNQIVSIIGNYIEASWRFPFCVDNKTSCEQIRRLWVQLRAIMLDESTHLDTLKSCVTVMRNCMSIIIESDHCLHIIEHLDISNLINLYLRTNFKPLKVELLSLFASIDFRSLQYLERTHWSKMMSRMASSLVDSLQDRIIRDVIIESLTDDHKQVRQAALAALLDVLPRLFISTANTNPDELFKRSPDTIVALAQDLAEEHLEVLRQAQDFPINEESEVNEKPPPNSIRIMSSSILQSKKANYNNNITHNNYQEMSKNYHHTSIGINLKFVVECLNNEFNDKFDRGKSAISAIVQAMYELSIVYPIIEYASSWDCRPSEYCSCFVTLNMLLTHMENLAEPDIIVEDIETYRNFLQLTCQLLYAVCHQCVLATNENQRMKPIHKRQAATRDGDWSELTIKPVTVAACLDKYFTHLIRLLCLLSAILEELPYPFSTSSKQHQTIQQSESQHTIILPEDYVGSHSTLMSNNQLYTRAFKKLESSYRSSKISLNQSNERFYQILETCLSNLSSILEFINMKSSLCRVKDILGYLRITSQTCSVPSLICARQLLKSLFGINIIALYQVDPIDWFDDKLWFQATQKSTTSQQSNNKENNNPNTVYHHLITYPYKIISKYYSVSCFNTPSLNHNSLTLLDNESRRAMIVRRRVEERVKALFETNYLEQSVKMRTITDTLKTTITEFTPIVKLCMSQFDHKGFCLFQSEVVHFMSYLLLLRVNFYKLENSQNLINSIDKLLDNCGEKKFASRTENIEHFLRYSFTFLTLLTYERGPSKPMFQVAAVIQKLDDMRAKICMTNITEKDVTTYIVPLLRCLVEDLFIYRTYYFQSETGKTEFNPQTQTLIAPKIKDDQENQKDLYQQLEAERETVAQRLLDTVENPEVYDLLAILILESRWDTSEMKYKKLSQLLLSIIPPMLANQTIRFTNYRSIDSARQIIEHISPEIFRTVEFVFDSLIDVPEMCDKNYPKNSETFHRWMALVIIAIHVLTTQVKEEIFLSRLQESMTVSKFVEYLLQIAQICMAELIIRIDDIKYLKSETNTGLSDLSSDNDNQQNSDNSFLLIQQLSSYILYLTRMFQSGAFFQLSKTATDLIKRSTSKRKLRSNIPFSDFISLCDWARKPDNGFSLDSCELMFFHIRLIYPDLTIIWCNLMMLLNNVDCNQKFWRDLLIYECHHCSDIGDIQLTNRVDLLTLESSTEDEVSPSSTMHDDGCDQLSSHTQKHVKDESKFRRSNHINRPASLNMSEINLENQLRRSFIKKIAEVETKDKPLNRNIVETSDDDGKLRELQVNLGNTEQCLSPNMELTRRGALCLVLDFVTITMNDVEHIVWLIIHQINDIIRWSNEPPISEYITAVHSNSASSGIFIQAINWSFTNLNSVSLVRKLKMTLHDVHYTQYGSLVSLLVEKLLSSKELQPYMSVTREIEEFACKTVENLLNQTNRSLMPTNEEVFNQLGAEDLTRIYSMLDHDLYPNLSRILIALSEVTQDMHENPLVDLPMLDMNDSDDDSDSYESDILYKKADLIYLLAERGETSRFTVLIPALNSIRDHLADKPSLKRINHDKPLACRIISAIYSLASTTRLGHAKRLIKPKIWSSPKQSNQSPDREITVKDRSNPLGGIQFSLNLDLCHNTFSGDKTTATSNKQKPVIPPMLDLSAPPAAVASRAVGEINTTKSDDKNLLPRATKTYTQDELRETIHDACLKGLFLVENIEFLQQTQYEALYEVIIRLARLPLINSFVLTPAQLWKQNIWPIWSTSDEDSDHIKTSAPSLAGSYELISSTDVKVANLQDIESSSKEQIAIKSNVNVPTTTTDSFKTNFPMVTHEILLKDLSLIDDFCDRLLLLGWINRRQFEEAWMTLLGVLSATMSYSSFNANELELFDGAEKKLNLVASCKLISSITRYLLLSNRYEIGNPLSPDIYPCQTFDSRVIDITKSIASNLGSLRSRTQGIFELLELERKMDLGKNIIDTQLIHKQQQQQSTATTSVSSTATATTISMNNLGLDPASITNITNDGSSFNRYLRVSAEKLRFNATEMQDMVVIDRNQVDLKRDEPDIGSCIKLLLSVYKQKFINPDESLYEPSTGTGTTSPYEVLELTQTSNNSSFNQQMNALQSPSQTPTRRQSQTSFINPLNTSSSSHRARPVSQIPPPLASAICQSILALSDLFTELDQFDWMFETFIDMFKLAERNEDDIQLQYLIVGLCKSVAICCYELPSEQVTSITAANHREVMFEKCRQCIEKCMKSDFGPLRLNALSGAFYMLEDSIHIVASGAYELEHFAKFRSSRLNWIHRLTPILLSQSNQDNNLRILTNRSQIIKLLEALCQCVGAQEIHT